CEAQRGYAVSRRQKQTRKDALNHGSAKSLPPAQQRANYRRGSARERPPTQAHHTATTSLAVSMRASDSIDILSSILSGASKASANNPSHTQSTGQAQSARPNNAPVYTLIPPRASAPGRIPMPK